MVVGVILHLRQWEQRPSSYVNVIFIAVALTRCHCPSIRTETPFSRRQNHIYEYL